VLDAQNLILGLTVARVVENSPAAAAGLREGDILLEVDGRALREPRQLEDWIETRPVGAPLVFRVERDRRVIEVEARTVARVGEPPPAGPRERFVERRLLGFEFRSPTPETNARLEIAPREGIEVVRLAEASPLAEAGLAEGDVIDRIDGETIHSPERFLALLEAKEDEGRVALRIAEAGGRSRVERVELHRPDREMTKFRVPLVVRYERERDRSEFSMLLGLFSRKRLNRTVAYRVLWFIGWETGESGALLIGAERD
jgi:serine protease Do